MCKNRCFSNQLKYRQLDQLAGKIYFAEIILLDLLITKANFIFLFLMIHKSFLNRRPIYLKVILGLVIFYLFPLTGNTTHIVGGEMTYQHLSGDIYEIQLTVFRDCLNGSPGAPFDPEASIGVYNSDMELIDSLFIPFMGDDTLSPTLFNECLVIPPSVCVHRTTYRANINLPPRIGGYNLIYQRCCRNQTINNLVEPLATGATFSVVIRDVALVENNTSPQFKEWPPIYICADEPIIFDHSATDAEGDSIVYRICTPFDGGAPGNPIPRPAFQTVPEEVQWLDPPYSLDNLLNGIAGGEPLEIDEQTGLLTGLPNTIGQFVVGICMDEYRDGVLLSTVRRDFQYNVGECGQTTASFFSPSFQCDSLTVSFDNLSTDADSFLWLFNDLGNPGAFSTEASPTYTFSDTGLYNVMLIANPGGFCEDTFYRDIQLLPASLMPDFSFTYEECSDSLVLQITDLTTDAVSTPVDWQWQLSLDGQVVGIDSVQSPSFTIFDTGDLELNLFVTAANGCAKEITLPIPNIIIGNPLIATDTVICFGESLALLADIAPNLNYLWAPGTGIVDVNQAQQLVMPTTDETYSVTITSDNNVCRVERNIFIQVPEPVNLAVPPDFTTCDPIVDLTVSSNQTDAFIWAEDLLFQNIIGNTATISVEPLGATTYFVQGIDTFGCRATDSLVIIGEGINVDAIDPPPICPGALTNLGLVLTDPSDVLQYLWYPTTYLIDPATDASPQVDLPGSGIYTFYVDLENQFNCTLTDSIDVVVLDTTSLLDFTSTKQCDGFEIQFFNNSINAPFILWDFGDPSNPNSSSTETNPAYTYPDTGTYVVSLTLDLDVPCKDTFYQTIEIGEPSIVADFNYYFESCGDSVVVVFEDASTSTLGNIDSWDWTFSTGEVAKSKDTSITLYETQFVTIDLKVTSDDGCEAEVSETVIIRLIETFLPDSMQICLYEPQPLNPDGIVGYNYEWFPAIGLDDPFSANPLANPTQTTTYSVTITDFTPDTCQVVREVTVVVPPDFTFDAPEDISTCQDEVTLSIDNPGPYSYAWSDDPDFNTILDLGTMVTVAPGRPGLYYLQAIDDFGCPKIDTIQVFDQAINIDAEDASICIGDTQRLLLTNNYPEDDLTVVWSPTNSIVEGLNTINPLVQPEETTTYTYYATNQYGCVASGAVTVSVLDIELPLQVAADPDTIVLGESSQLSATIDDAYIYSWNPDASLSALDIPDPIATPEVTTTYELLVEDGDQCSSSRTVTVVVINPVCEEPNIFFPNAFSPNGDGENDELGVLGQFVEEMHLMIFNRWGQKVFESRDQSNTWNGFFNGRLVEPDVFGYYLEVRCINGAEFRKQGNVMLLR